jgi:hypothetical protein
LLGLSSALSDCLTVSCSAKGMPRPGLDLGLNSGSGSDSGDDQPPEASSAQVQEGLRAGSGLDDVLWVGQLSHHGSL